MRKLKHSTASRQRKTSTHNTKSQKLLGSIDHAIAEFSIFEVIRYSILPGLSILSSDPLCAMHDAQPVINE
jgi:hypothetical protein